jgi:hypothetical protein
MKENHGKRGSSGKRLSAVQTFNFFVRREDFGKAKQWQLLSPVTPTGWNSTALGKRIAAQGE